MIKDVGELWVSVDTNSYMSNFPPSPKKDPENPHFPLFKSPPHHNSTISPEPIKSILSNQLL